MPGLGDASFCFELFDDTRQERLAGGSSHMVEPCLRGWRCVSAERLDHSACDVGSSTRRPRSWGALVAPSIIAPSGQFVTPGWDQSAYVFGFVVAMRTRRMVPFLASGLAMLLLVATVHT